MKQAFTSSPKPTVVLKGPDNIFSHVRKLPPNKFQMRPFGQGNCYPQIWQTQLIYLCIALNVRQRRGWRVLIRAATGRRHSLVAGGAARPNTNPIVANRWKCNTNKWMWVSFFMHEYKIWRYLLYMYKNVVYRKAKKAKGKAKKGLLSSSGQIV